MDIPDSSQATSLEHFRQLQREEEAARQAAATPAADTAANDFPTNPGTQLAMVNEMVDAMQNMEGIVDNYVNNVTENDAARFVLNAPRKDLVKEAWKLMDKCQDTQLGKLDPGAYSPPEITSAMTRWRLMVNTFRVSPSGLSRYRYFAADLDMLQVCKAAVSDLFAVSFVQRYAANPVAELDVSHTKPASYSPS